MRVIMVGAEYAGKTTLANTICEWMTQNMGGRFKFHDHFTIPNTELEDDAAKEFMKINPQIKEQYQRFIMAHHLELSFYANPDHNMVGYHIEEAVYAPLYYGYGGENSGSPKRSPKGQRTYWARFLEKQVLEIAPETVLVLVKATPEVIKQRMKAAPHKYQVVPKKDVEFVLKRFQEEYDNSLIWKRFEIDTSEATVEQSLASFWYQYEPYMTPIDRQRVLAHQIMKQHFIEGAAELKLHESMR